MFDNDTYIGWRNSRISTIKKVLTPNFFKNKKILEVGCGYADISNSLIQEFENVTITASEGRIEHLQEMERRQSRGILSNKIKLLHHDSDKPWKPENGEFDIIIHWGLLYHLEDPKSHLTDILKYTKCIILETEVCDSDEPVCQNLSETGYDQALNGKGSRPSAVYVENILRENNFSFERLDIPELNYDYHKYDWEAKNDGACFSGMRRFWVGFNLN
jgi:SAM-dependent methyltransferase